jgi:osmoprotectant transport system substrate-binding protein
MVGGQDGSGEVALVDNAGRLRRLVAVASILALLSPLACGGAGQPGATKATGRDHHGVVMASFNFPESVLLVEIYAQAVEGAGIPVDLELNLGPRELVLPAFQQGLVDVVPEYLGAVLSALDPALSLDSSDSAAVHAELAKALQPWHGRVLNPSPAQNQDGLVVTRATADKDGLRSVSDLARVAAHFTLGGPPECPIRTYCLLGLQRVYGLRFGGFVPLDTEQQVVTALDEQVVDVGLMFTTDASLATGDLLLLADDRRLQPAENVVPMISAAAVARYGSRLTGMLDAVSARLTTENLRFLNWRIVIGGKDPAAEARGWLERQGLLTRSR